MRERLLGGVAILVALAADQTVKLILQSGALSALDGSTLIPGVLSVRFTWNRGVSFSLLWQTGDLGRLLLLVGLAGVVAVLSAWLFRARRTLEALAIGFLIGGALSNLVDRYRYGAVFDFLQVRFGYSQLFICNVADVFITFGVILLLIDALWIKGKSRALS